MTYTHPKTIQLFASRASVGVGARAEGDGGGSVQIASNTPKTLQLFPTPTELTATHLNQKTIQLFASRATCTATRLTRKCGGRCEGGGDGGGSVHESSATPTIYQMSESGGREGGGRGE